MASVVLMPKLGLTMEAATVVRWHKREGEAVEKGEVLVEVETDKILNQVESPASGRLLRVLVPEGTEARVQAPLAVVGEPGEELGPLAEEDLGAQTARQEAGSPGSTAAAGQEAGAGLPSGRGPRPLTPRARKLLARHGLSPADLAGISKSRITEADVQELLDRRRTKESSPEADEGGAGELVPMSRLQSIAAARLTESFRDIPQFSLRFQVEMEHILGLLPRIAADAGMRITINDLILRAAALALGRVPAVQYQYRDAGIYRPKGVHLGLAVSVEQGLLVPVIRDAERKSLVELAREAARLIALAREQGLRGEDVGASTFTLSNLGMFGVSSFVPIVNPGEGAILGVGAVQKVPWIRNDELTAARVVELTLVCDHRVVDGATGAAFCRELKKIVETQEATQW